MAENKQDLQKIFDFSQNAKAFRNRLWHQIKDSMNDLVQPLEDDDLAWVNAAGVSHPRPDDKNGK